MKNEIRSKLEEMRKEYEKLPREELASLRWKELDNITIKGKKYKSTVWSEQLDDKLLLAVQLERKIFLSFVKETNCIGFLFHRNGKIEHVNEEFMWNEIGYP